MFEDVFLKKWNEKEKKICTCEGENFVIDHRNNGFTKDGIVNIDEWNQPDNKKNNVYFKRSL